MVSDLAVRIDEQGQALSAIASAEPTVEEPEVVSSTFSINFLDSKVTSINSVTPVDWTLVDVSADVPASAVGIILEVYMKITTNTGIIQAFVRKDSSSIELEIAHCHGEVTADLNANMNQPWVELTRARTFDYKLTDSNDSGGPNNFEIRIVGYW